MWATVEGASNRRASSVQKVLKSEYCRGLHGRARDVRNSYGNSHSGQEHATAGSHANAMFNGASTAAGTGTQRTRVDSVVVLA